ncbi:MAG: hypothetical protein IKZ43_07680 [Acidaminococcaceae bacterium]|nr:hypothetical protein [Acidaminococcaceae bacterium]
MIFDVIAHAPLIPGTSIYVDWADIGDSLVAVALLTVLIEVPLFYFCGYRKAKELAGFAMVNMVSNMLLNEFLEQMPSGGFWIAVILGEIAVILLEFCLCSYFIKGDRKKLFKTLVLMNVCSVVLGEIFFWLYY